MTAARSNRIVPADAASLRHDWPTVVESLMSKDVTARSWPMRWPTDPRWLALAALDVLKESPIDCLIVPWSPAGPDLRPFLGEAGRRGMALVALLPASADPAAALAAGFDAVTSSEAGQKRIPWTTRSAMPYSSTAPVLAATDNVWPSVKANRVEGWAGGAGAAAFEAGPTGVPWVDSNGYFIQMARALAPEKGIWIVADAPDKINGSRAEAYALAVADAVVYSGRWVLALDDAFAAELITGAGSGPADWKHVVESLRLFAAHQEWSAYRPFGCVGIVSDFRGDNEFLSGETLNLISRRHVPFKVLEKSKLRDDSFAGLKAIIYADGDLPDAALRKRFLAFTQAGGLLICPKSSASLASGPGVPDAHGRFAVTKLGSGRIAIATDDQIDPFLYVVDSHIMLGRRHDLVRIWNPGAANSYYAGSPDSRKGLLQIISYTRRPVADMSVQLSMPWSSARFVTSGAADAAPLKPIKKSDAVEFNLPSFTVYCALELEK